MKLVLGADHAGFRLKGKLLNWLTSVKGGQHVVRDVGTYSDASCDYPDIAKAAANLVAGRKVDRGLLICGTGIGMAMAANKIHGIRAAVAWNPKTAGLAAEHNGANILCLPGRYVNLKKAQVMIRAFLETPFGGGRHARRIRKIDKLSPCP